MIKENKVYDKVIGYTTGVFDMFHIGHLNILEQAKENCDYLIVGVTTDSVTKQMKKKEPIIPYKERLEIVKNIKFVDKAIAKDNIDNLKAWENLKFDVYFKGDDWKGTEKGRQLETVFREVGVEIKYFPYTGGTSSTHLRKIIQQTIRMNDMEDFIVKFKIKELKIKDLEYWTISIRPKQPTIGSMVLSLKRPCPQLSDITREEAEEMKDAFFQVRELLNVKFNPDKINYLALMMVDNQVHFHVIPRYQRAIYFSGKKYEDKEWPKPPNVLKSLEIKKDTLHELCMSFRKMC